MLSCIFAAYSYPDNMLVDTVFTFESCCQNRSNTILGNSCRRLQSHFSYECILPGNGLSGKANAWKFEMRLDLDIAPMEFPYELKCEEVLLRCLPLYQARLRQLSQMLFGSSLDCLKIPMCPLATTACSGHGNWAFLVFHVLRKLYFPKPRWRWLNPTSRFLCVRMHVNTCKIVFFHFVCMTFIFNYFILTAIDPFPKYNDICESHCVSKV